MLIRSFKLGDEEALHGVFQSAVHSIASRDYTPEQLETWAPRSQPAVTYSRRNISITSSSPEPLRANVSARHSAAQHSHAAFLLDVYLNGRRRRRALGYLGGGHVGCNM